VDNVKNKSGTAIEWRKQVRRTVGRNTACTEMSSKSQEAAQLTEEESIILVRARV
jgi:hypothetical protein